MMLSKPHRVRSARQLRVLGATTALLCLPLLAVAGAVVAPDRPTWHAGAPVAERLAAVQDAWRARAGATGVVASVRDGDRLTWTEASGLPARGSTDDALATSARFRIASITKTFVAVVVLQLVEERRIVLDAPVTAYLPSVAADPVIRGVTVRQLLNHTSGVPDYTAIDEDFVDGLVRDRDRRWSTTELVDLAASTERDFPAGSDLAYSNTGYLLLGMVVEHVTGRPWAEELRRRVLDPLRLRHTYVAGEEAGPPVVAGYHDLDADGEEENLETGTPWVSLESSEGAAGAVVSTASDVRRFADALFGGRLLDPRSIAAMTQGTAYGSPVRNHGLGLELGRFDWETLTWGHGGYVPGFRSVMWHLPSQDRTVVVLVNSGAANPADLAELLLRTLDPPER